MRMLNQTELCISHTEKLRQRKTRLVQEHTPRTSLAEPTLNSDLTKDFTNWTQMLQLPSQGLLQKEHLSSILTASNRIVFVLGETNFPV